MPGTDGMTPWTDPFFVVGFGRSGTTLLAAMLDRHPRLCVTPETAFFTEAMRPFRHAPPGPHERLLEAWLSFPRFADLGVSGREVATRFHLRPADPAGLFAATLDAYRHRRGKPRVGEKTPAHLWLVPRIFDSFPAAKILCLLRDGRDCVNSMLKTPWGKGSPVRVAMQWANAARLGEQLARRYGGERFRVIRYEDLLQDPVAVMGDVMSFLGEQFHPGQLDPSNQSAVVPAWEMGWKGKVGKHLDPSRCHAWRRENEPAFTWRINALIGPTLRHMGYPDTGLDGCPTRLRARFLAEGALYRQARKPHHLRAAIAVGDWLGSLGSIPRTNVDPAAAPLAPAAFRPRPAGPVPPLPHRRPAA